MRTRTQIVEAVLRTAAGEIGERETSTNWSPDIASYLRMAGYATPQPWCCAFTYWATHTTLQRLELPNPVVRTGYCPLVQTWAREHEILRDTPERGDYFLYINGGRARHIGFVTEVSGARFGTIEGNTNLGGSPEGIGVFARSRPRSHQYQFVRWVDVLQLAGDQSRTIVLEVAGDRWADLPVIDGRALVPVRWWGQKMGFRVDWDAEHQAVLFDGREVPTEVTLLNGQAHAPVREVARWSGLLVSYTSGRVVVSRG